MMCSKFLKVSENNDEQWLANFVDKQFENLHRFYRRILNSSLDTLPVTAVFAVIILTSIYFLFISASSELAPQEDQGIIISQLTAAPNATLQQTQMYSKQVYEVFKSFPETDHSFSVDGEAGLNTNISGMILKPWNERKRTSNQLQPLLQNQLNNIAGAKIAAFQLPSLPGSQGLPIQFVIETTDPFELLNDISQQIENKALASGMFLYIDSDLKLDEAQTNIDLDRDKASELGLNMQDVGNLLTGALSSAYINYFNYSGRSYQVIPQVIRASRLNPEQVLNYYINTASGIPVPLSTIAKLKNIVVPESLNHFQQLNSATISAVPAPGVSMGTALNSLQKIAKQTLPLGYTTDYAGQSRQYIQEGSSLAATFIFALIIIFLSLSAFFQSFRDPFIVLISVPMSICGAMIFISLGIGGATLNIYTELGLITLIGLISKHGILIVQFANELQREGKDKRDAVVTAAGIRLRPILMTTAAMVLGVVPLLIATGAGAESRFDIGLVIASGISIGTLFTLFVVPAMYMFLAEKHEKIEN